METSAPTAFGGSGDLLAFLDRINIWKELKNFQGQKKALALASRLEGPAFDNYLRLSEDEKNSVDAFVKSLEREFLRRSRPHASTY